MTMRVALAAMLACAGCDGGDGSDAGPLGADAGGGTDAGVMMAADAGDDDAATMMADAGGAADAGASDAGAGADAGADAGEEDPCLAAFFAGAAGTHTATATAVNRTAEMYFVEGESYPLVVDDAAWTITFEDTSMGDVVYDFRSADLLSDPRCSGDDAGRLVQMAESGAYALNANHAAGTGEWRALNPTIGGGFPLPGNAEFDVTTP